MPHAAVFTDWPLRIQPLPINRTFPGIGIYREITDLKGGEILKEMAALRWSDAKIAEAGFDNDASGGDFIPLDWNAEPGIVRTPAANPDQQIRTILGIEYSVEMSDGLGDFLAAAALEALRIDDHNIAQIFDPAVAENFTGLAEDLTLIGRRNRQILVIAGKRERPDLQETEFGSFARMTGQACGKFDFHGNA